MERILIVLLSFIFLVGCEVDSESDENSTAQYKRLNKRYQLGGLPSHESLSRGNKFGQCYPKDKSESLKEMRINMNIRISSRAIKKYNERYHIALVNNGMNKAKKDEVFDFTERPKVYENRLEVETEAYEESIVRFEIVEHAANFIVKIFELNEDLEVTEVFMCEFKDI